MHTYTDRGQLNRDRRSKIVLNFDRLAMVRGWGWGRDPENFLFVYRLEMGQNVAVIILNDFLH